MIKKHAREWGRWEKWMMHTLYAFFFWCYSRELCGTSTLPQMLTRLGHSSERWAREPGHMTAMWQTCGFFHSGIRGDRTSAPNGFRSHPWPAGVFGLWPPSAAVSGVWCEGVGHSAVCGWCCLHSCGGTPSGDHSCFSINLEPRRGEGKLLSIQSWAFTGNTYYQ